jgi:hypothetical protein
MANPINLTKAWVQITNGSNSIAIQAKRGMVHIATGATAPTSAAVGLTIEGSEKLTIAAPAIAWARADGSSALLAVQTW